MTLSLPLIFNLGPTELIIILVIVLLLFGGSRLAGLGKSSGRALKEFKEETRGLRDGDKAAEPPAATPTATPVIQPPQVVNGNVAPTPPAETVYPQTPPNNLADPSATEVRKDV
jgi:sec-independent protein translocase protein TatA